MKPVFVDTAALIAMGDIGDQFHYQAMMVREELKKSQKDFVTTNAVILELASYFCQSHRRSTAIKLIETITKSDKWNCITIDDTLMQRGFARYKQMTDKDWSLVDCICMIVAEDMGITEILTVDHHFEQSGFTIFLN